MPPLIARRGRNCYNITHMNTAHHSAKIIAFVGLAGSGKSSAVEYFTQKGIPKVYFGGIIYKAMAEAGIEPTWDNQQQFREEIRAKEGKDFVVKRAVTEVQKLIEAGQKRIVLDGLYSWSEYKILKHAFPGQMSVIAIVTPKHLRYQRMAKRPERPMQPHEIDQRDWSEIENLEKGGPIAIADYFIVNDSSHEKLYQQLEDLTQQEHFCKAPEQC